LPFSLSNVVILEDGKVKLFKAINCENSKDTLDDVIKCNIWLADARDFWSFNRVYAEFFPSEPPARSTLQSGFMLDCKVEIEALAYKPL